MKISLIVPNRNNLKYFKWSYDSIRKNQGNREVWICSAVDACTDGTLEWYEELSKKDPYFKYIVNSGPERLGLTILYNKIVEDIVETDLVMVWHCDMYLCPGALDEIEKLMYDGENLIKNRIVSLTRIEPPLHPGGKEKIVGNFGIEPESFDEDGLFAQLDVWSRLDNWEYTCNFNPNQPMKFNVPLKGTTSGIFAPWTVCKDEFLEINGHDYLFTPQSKEDDDLWNRFLLNGTEFVQTREGYCYHMTCRGSRFNPYLTTPGKSSEEWEFNNRNSMLNFIRKWQSFPKHDKWHHPIMPKHRRNIGFILRNCGYDFISALEPWCDRLVYVELEQEIIDTYVKREQHNTKFDLKTKMEYGACETDVIVEIDGQRFNQTDFINIQHLSDIITQANELGEFELGNLKITIRSLQTYEKDLVVCKNEPITLN
jgi:glycosyltransferase involved in cell wall biosynthesis